MLRPELSVNGGALCSLGMSSGCISKTDFESAFTYYWVDLGQLENEADDNTSKSVQFFYKRCPIRGYHKQSLNGFLHLLVLPENDKFEYQ